MVADKAAKPNASTARGEVGRVKALALRRSRVAVALGVTVALSSRVSPVAADPLRLRGDALAESRGESSPAGLLVLQGQDAIRPWMDVEGLVWTGTKPSWAGDVLVLMVRVREPHGYGEARIGRFMIATGSVRPLQIDGLDLLGRTRWGSQLETFGGAPVVPRWGPRAYDWVVGGRVAQTFASLATIGVSYIHRRENGEVSDEELGCDLAAAPARWLDLAAFASYDLLDLGVTEARASAAARAQDLRLEVFASHLSPGRLLPATSLFSVLGDLPSQTLGATVRWHAAPRLDLLVSSAGQDVGGTLGGNGWARGLLRLDDHGERALGMELRRVDLPGAQWSGVRGTATAPLGRGFRYSAEVEIVVPDQPRGQGVAFPWGLWALSWRSRDGWEVAAAVEASATPLHRFEADALARLSRTFDASPARHADAKVRP